VRWRQVDEYHSVSDCGYKISVAGGVYVAWVPGCSEYGGFTPIGFFRDDGAGDRVAAAVAVCEQHWGQVNESKVD